MKSKKDFVYIFVHIPKTAGTTLVQHVAKNFKKEEILEISSKALNLSEKFDKRTYEREIKNFLKNKTHKQLNKIKFVHGHAIPYGIHKYFKKEARYITFIRNPVRRIPSIYNYFYTLFERKKDKELEKRLNRVFLVKDEIPEFKTWYKAKFRRKSKDIAFMSTHQYENLLCRYSIQPRLYQ